MEPASLCFFCFAALDANAEACQRCGKPTFVVTAQGRRPNTRRLNTVLPSAAGPRTMFSPPPMATLPPQVDLRPMLSTIEDQGQVGSCAANAAVGAFEYHLRKQGATPVELSRLFVYYNGRRAGGRLNQDIGLTIGEAMAALVAYGAPPEEYWPYDPAKWATEPPKVIYDWAFQTRAREFACVKKGDGLRSALARGFPVVFSMNIPMVCFTEAATTGVLRAPTSQEEQGGVVWHAMLVVGYDMNTSEYIIRNSWGATWGDKGYCRMSFSVMDNRSAAEEYWIIGHLGQDDVAPRSTAPATTTAEPQNVAGMAARLREEIRGSLTRDIEDATKNIKDRLRGT